jgi:hypothetical protein
VLHALGEVGYVELWEEVACVLGGHSPLFLAGGFESAEDFLAAELPDETLRSALGHILVARSFSPADAARHGLPFLEEVALYARELVGAAVAPRAIDLDRLTVPVARKGALPGRKPVREASLAEIRKARRALRTTGELGLGLAPAEVALRAALAAHAPLAGVSVRAGAHAASFGGVPLASLAAFARALARVELPRAK